MEKAPKPEPFELNEEEKRLVESIERLPVMNDSDIADIILAWRGLKPATEVPIVVGEDGDKEKILSQARNLFKSLGLYHRESPSREIFIEQKDKSGKILESRSGFYFYVSKDAAAAEKLSKFWSLRFAPENRVENQAELGRLFGYPETAVEFWVSTPAEERQGYTDFMKMISGESGWQDFMAFAQFRLSPDNWREELETPRRWAEEIKKIDPGLYERMVRYARESLGIGDRAAASRA